LRDEGITADGAVVRNESVAVVVPFIGRLNDVRLHVVSEGWFPHNGVIVTMPLLLNPFCAVIVSTVVPTAPGALTGIVVGFAEIVNVGPFTVRVALVGVVAVR